MSVGESEKQRQRETKEINAVVSFREVLGFLCSTESITHTHTQIPDTISSMLFSEVFSPHWVFLLPAAFFFFFTLCFREPEKKMADERIKAGTGMERTGGGSMTEVPFRS